MSCDTPAPQFAREIGVSPDTVLRWAHQGLIDAERRGPRLIFVDPTTFRAERVGDAA